MTAKESDSFTGKVAFVSGGTSGTGQATAQAFAQAGASVVVADISEPGIRDTARMIEGAGGKVHAVRCDVARTEDVKAALHSTVEAFGRLDFAFNNAGVEQPIVPKADLTEAEWDRTASVNVRGVFLCMKYQIPLMLKQGGGTIVNTSSARYRRTNRSNAGARRASERLLYGCCEANRSRPSHGRLGSSRSAWSGGASAPWPRRSLH